MWVSASASWPGFNRLDERVLVDCEACVEAWLPALALGLVGMSSLLAEESSVLSPSESLDISIVSTAFGFRDDRAAETEVLLSSVLANADVRMLCLKTGGTILPEAFLFVDIALCCYVVVAGRVELAVMSGQLTPVICWTLYLREGLRDPEQNTTWRCSANCLAC